MTDEKEEAPPPGLGVVFEQDLMAKSIENLPGVYVQFPTPRALEEGQLDLGESMNFGEMFSVVDCRGPNAQSTKAAVNPISRPESDFTSPSSWCPRPDRWKAYDADTTEIEVIELAAAFVRAIKPDLILETGSAFGHMAEALGKAVLANGSGLVISLESDPDRYVEACHRVEGLPVQVLMVDSLSWTPPGPIGFAWLDSALDIRQKELERFRPFLQGAIVGIHDTGPQHPVKRSLQSLHQNEEWFKRINLRTPRGVTFGEVIA